MALKRGSHRHVNDMRSKHSRECGGRKRSPLADRSNMMMDEERLRQFRCIEDYIYLAMEDKKRIRVCEYYNNYNKSDSNTYVFCTVICDITYCVVRGYERDIFTAHLSQYSIFSGWSER